MTKKDYIKIAAILAEAKPDSERLKDYHADNVVDALELQWGRIVRKIADALLSDNPCFDPSRFLKACGI